MSPSLRYLTLGNKLPRALSVPLFGDRHRYGKQPFPGDPCWQEWLHIYERFYCATQHEGVRGTVNHSGYTVMRRLDLSGKRVLEIGPGTVAHMDQWRGAPAQYDLLDVNEGMMAEAIKALSATQLSHTIFLRPPSEDVALPLPDDTYDVVISFYSLEHLDPLDRYVAEIVRVLKIGGYLIGGIPAEGGIAWGLGRFFTTRRWFRKNSGVDPDKWVCWEHPNFAEHILIALDAQMERLHLSFYPFFFLPLIDPNLIIRFLYRKR